MNSIAEVMEFFFRKNKTKNDDIVRAAPREMFYDGVKNYSSVYF